MQPRCLGRRAADTMHASTSASPGGSVNKAMPNDCFVRHDDFDEKLDTKMAELNQPSIKGLASVEYRCHRRYL